VNRAPGPPEPEEDAEQYSTFSRYRSTVRSTGKVALLIKRFESMPRLSLSASDSDCGEMDEMKPAPRRSRSLHAVEQKKARSRSSSRSTRSNSRSSSSDAEMLVAAEDAVDQVDFYAPYRTTRPLAVLEREDKKAILQTQVRLHIVVDQTPVSAEYSAE
jgi:hypothetical protein